MLKTLRGRFAVIAALSALSLWFLWDRGITLGLDLQGGTYLALEVADPEGEMDRAEREDAIDRALTVIRTRIDELGVAEPAIQKAGSDRILVELPGATAQEQSRAKDIIQRSAFLEFRHALPGSELEGALPRVDRAVSAALGDEPPTQEELDTAPSPLGILQPVEGEDQAADRDRPFTALLSPLGLEGGFAVSDADVPAVERYLAIPGVERALPRGTELLWGFTPEGEETGFRELYLVETEAVVTGEFLVDAAAQRDIQFNQPIVTFEFNRQGGRRFERFTSANIGELLAIVLDDQVVSAPVIRGAIGTSGQIELGGSTLEEASDLALVLRAGALPAPIEIVEERTVGPSLGSDSVEQGKLAGMIGIVLVILTMIGYYRLAGVLAVAALGLYVLYVMGGLASIGATLTLPGIAGLILSIGMAVDANVLIFERIREELAAGRSPRTAVSEGFRNALSAIVDGNLTTLITGFILFYFGTGPVRGFAVTLVIGIVASMFSAIFVTRTFFTVYLDRKSAGSTVSV
ncbi:MAG: protein translocase subunit SecD [Longimicrobiaceae bacterium]